MGEAKRRRRVSDAEIEPQYREKMREIARILDAVFNSDAKGNERKTGFVLLLFPFGEAEEGRTNYISNGADRKDIAILFREMAARFEGQPELQGRA
jgi:hypothetical protein